MSPRARLEALCGPGPARVLWLSLASAEVAEIAALSGADACVIDTEHGRIGTGTMAAMVRAVTGAGRQAFVRVAELSEARIKHALDAGASGCIVPYVETVEQARAAVRSHWFPPLGARGDASAIVRASGYGGDRDYGAAWNGRGLLILQIESRKGLAAAAEIATVEGVDMLFLGPGDYARDAGLSLREDGDEIARAARAMCEAAHRAGKLSGLFPWPGQVAASLAGLGGDMVAVGSDVALVSSTFRSALS